MTDLRAEATRIGYWNEGQAQFTDPDLKLSPIARALIRKPLTQTAREDAHIDDCD